MSWFLKDNAALSLASRFGEVASRQFGVETLREVATLARELKTPLQDVLSTIRYVCTLFFYLGVLFAVPPIIRACSYALSVLLRRKDAPTQEQQ